VAETNNTPLPATPLLALKTNTPAVGSRLSAHGDPLKSTIYGHRGLSRTPIGLTAQILSLRFALAM